jgi:hypothetical protein
MTIEQEIDELIPRFVPPRLEKELREAVQPIITKAMIDPFDFVEPCEPECSDTRHAYHQGQWDMAVRIKEQLNRSKAE